MTKDKEEGIRRNSKRTWTELLALIHSLLSILRPTKLLPIRVSPVNNIEGTDNNIISKWTEIGDDVLCSILHRLSPLDYLQAQTVCLSWQSAISRLITNHHGPPSPKLPLVLFNSTHQKNHFSLFNLSTKSLFSHIADSLSTTIFPTEFICHGTIQGWVIMVEVSKISFRGRIFFFNPVTKTKVYMRSTLCRGQGIKKIIVSAKPTDPNCVVVCLFYYQWLLRFSLMPGKSWTKIVVDESATGINFVEAEIFDGKLYALTDQRFNSLVVCDLRTEPVKFQVLAKLPATGGVSVTREVYVRYPSSPVLRSQGLAFKSLAIDASSKELLLVYMFFKSECVRGSFIVSPPNVTRIEVFKLDNITSGKPKWIEVRNLKNRMLYVDRTRSLVVSNLDVHGPKELTEENCIYFAYQFPFERVMYQKPWNGMRIGRHCKSDGTTSYYKFEIPTLDKVSIPVWFIPHLNS